MTPIRKLWPPITLIRFSYPKKGWALWIGDTRISWSCPTGSTGTIRIGRFEIWH